MAAKEQRCSPDDDSPVTIEPAITLHIEDQPKPAPEEANIAVYVEPVHPKIEWPPMGDELLSSEEEEVGPDPEIEKWLHYAEQTKKKKSMKTKPPRPYEYKEDAGMSSEEELSSYMQNVSFL